MSHRIFSLFFLVSFSFSQAMLIKKDSLFVPKQLGDLAVEYKKKQFSINDVPVAPYNIGKELRGLSKADLAKLLAAGSYIIVKPIGDDNYRLELQYRIKGGGPLGAMVGAFIGKAAVSVVGHGLIWGIAALTGPAAVPVGLALESCFGPAIEGASMAGAVAVGMTGAVLTGPI